MALSFRTVQTQRQTLNPALWMRLGLLVKPITELRAEVKKEVESNPAIEDVDFSPYYRRGGVVSASTDADAVERIAAAGESLDEHLMSGIRLSPLSERDAYLAEQIVANLDENGRFVGSVPDLVMVTGATFDELEKARRFVLTLDPYGCGAKDNVECLMAQLVRIPASDRKDVAAIIERFDDLMAHRIDVSELDPRQRAVFAKYRGRLTVNPGASFAPKRVETVTPDIFVAPDGSAIVDTGDIPEIRVSQKYIEMAKDRSLDAETRQFAAERVARARQFRDAIINRNEMIEKVAAIVFERQVGFLKKGRTGLVKLTMSEVAAAVGCEISTVSRAAYRKYVRTPRGVFPLRDFFVLVDQAPVEKLRQILEMAPAEVRASSRKLAEQMREAGFPMAERTVRKYRAKLGFGAK